MPVRENILDSKPVPGKKDLIIINFLLIDIWLVSESFEARDR
jgi:hypothetical protein